MRPRKHVVSVGFRFNLGRGRRGGLNSTGFVRCELLRTVGGMAGRARGLCQPPGAIMNTEMLVSYWGSSRTVVCTAFHPACTRDFVP